MQSQKNYQKRKACAKWIGEIEFRDYDELGYWEKRGYSNTAEPWLNDRYS